MGMFRIDAVPAALNPCGGGNDQPASVDEMTGHGFRALASTRLNEMGWSPDVIERQLAHAERNKVRAAYNRAQHLAERRRMMQAWADALVQMRDGAEVVPIGTRAASGTGRAGFVRSR